MNITEMKTVFILSLAGLALLLIFYVPMRGSQIAKLIKQTIMMVAAATVFTGSAMFYNLIFEEDSDISTLAEADVLNAFVDEQVIESWTNRGGIFYVVVDGNECATEVDPDSKTIHVEEGCMPLEG